MATVAAVSRSQWQGRPHGSGRRCSRPGDSLTSRRSHPPMRVSPTSGSRSRFVPMTLRKLSPLGSRERRTKRGQLIGHACYSINGKRMFSS